MLTRLDTSILFAKFEHWAMTLGEESAIQSQDPEEKQAAVKSLQELSKKNKELKERIKSLTL